MTEVRGRKSAVSSLRSVAGKTLASSFCSVLFIVFCAPAHAQQQTKIPRIGYVRVVGTPSPAEGRNVEAFRRGLQELGYIEGKNILIEFRYAEGKLDRIPSLLADLVQLKVDVLLSGDDTTIRTAKQVTKTIPIVMVINQDPVATGLIDSLARPGGNVTGISRLTRELGGKRLELLTELLPGVTRIAILWDSSAEGPRLSFKEYQTAARALNMQLQSLEVRGPDPALAGAFQSAIKGRTGALIVIGNALLNRHRKQIANYAIKHKLPAMYESSLWIEPGGLISYSSNDAESYKRAAFYVDKLLKGATPADLPVEQPTDFELVVNLKAAKQIGLTIPPNLLARADKVIK